MAVSVEEALKIIYETIKTKSTKLLPIENALGFIIAQDIVATYNLPPYDNSAMDGYAVVIADTGKNVKVLHTIFAGDDFSAKVSERNAIKIMTGAKIPDGTEAIVPVEDTTPTDNGVTLPTKIRASQHIRVCGEDIQADDILIKKGETLSAYMITLLASQGISHINVYKKPRVSVFASGNELKMHYENVETYQLYNTNTPMIASRCKELGCIVDIISTAQDTLESIKEHIQSALESDIIITSGGISVGDADFTKEAFESFGAKILFDKIEIKPGKPTTFATIGEKYILNLPGNPLAAALNFELFGQSMILALSGATKKYLNTITTKMEDDFKSKGGRRSLIPGYFNGESFEVAKKFSPGMISPLGNSNAFMMIDESVNEIKKGDMIKVIPFTFSFYTQEQVSLNNLYT